MVPNQTQLEWEPLAIITLLLLHYIRKFSINLGWLVGKRKKKKYRNWREKKFWISVLTIRKCLHSYNNGYGGSWNIPSFPVWEWMKAKVWHYKEVVNIWRRFFRQRYNFLGYRLGFTSLLDSFFFSTSYEFNGCIVFECYNLRYFWEK